MRKSKLYFLEICTDIKVALQIESYTIYDYCEGCFADFKVKKLTDPVHTLEVTNGLYTRIIADNDNVIIRVYEELSEQ